MYQRNQHLQLRERLFELKSKISLLLPMIRCCKDELNDLTLQEMEIRSEMRIKLHAQMKQELLDPSGNSQDQAEVDETPKQILGLPFGMELQELESGETAISAAAEDERAVDYREFLTLDPRFIKADSDEEEDDDDNDEVGRDNSSEEDCENVLLTDNDDDDD